MRIVIKVLVFLLVVVAVLTAMLFSVENEQLVDVSFIVFTMELPISLWLMFTLLGGFILGLLASSGLFVRLMTQRRKMRRLEATHKKLATL